MQSCKFIIIVFLFNLSLLAADLPDPFIHLEPRNSKQAKSWVETTSIQSLETLTKITQYSKLKQQATKIYTRLGAGGSKPNLKNGHIYIFSKEKGFPFGVLKRTTLKNYNSNNTQWQYVLDIQDVHSQEKDILIPKEYTSLSPRYERSMFTFVSATTGLTSIREYTYRNKEKRFVKEQNNGFTINSIGLHDWIKWVDKNTLLVLSKRPNDPVNGLGEPIIIRKWQRGMELEKSTILFQADKNCRNVEYHPFRIQKNGKTKVFVIAATRYSDVEDDYALIDVAKEHKYSLPLPRSFSYQGAYRGDLLFKLHHDFPLKNSKIIAGSLIAIPMKKMLIISEQTEKIKSASFKKAVSNIYHKKILAEAIVLWQPDSHSTLRQVNTCGNFILVNILENVSGKLLQFTRHGGKYRKSNSLSLPANGSIKIIGDKVRGGDIIFGENDDSDSVLVEYQDFITPASLYLVSAKQLTSHINSKDAPAVFDASKYQIQQHFAKSKDGTMVPYYIVAAKNINLNSKNPTFIYGYGADGQLEVPYYLGYLGQWLEQGGIYVQANVRGGGEYGPRWQQAAILDTKHKSFEDVIGIAKDLIAQKITSPQHLGLKGVSSGGFLMNSVYVLRPDLFNAVSSEVALTDLLRFHVIGGENLGEALISSLGDPRDAKMYKYLSQYSPYHNIRKLPNGVNYPGVLFQSRSDDFNLHPGHSRKMYAKMKSFGIEVYLIEEPKGGHSGSQEVADLAKRAALEVAFLLYKLK